MKFLDHRSTRLALDFVLLMGALLLGFMSGQLIVSEGTKQIAAKMHAIHASPGLSRSTLSKAVKDSDDPSGLSPAPAVRAPFNSSVTRELSEKEVGDSRKTVVPVPRPPPPNAESNGPGNPLAMPAQPERLDAMSMPRIMFLQVLSSVAALLVGFTVLASILYFLQRRCGIRLRVEMTHAPSVASAGSFPAGQDRAISASTNLDSSYEHDRQQRAETEGEMLRHLCQQNLLLHRAIRQQARAP